MKLGTKILNGATTCCLLFAATGFAQTKFDPTHAMSPAQLQRVMMLSSGRMPSPAKAPEMKTATSPEPASGTHEGMEVYGRWTTKMGQTWSSRSERGKRQ